MKWNWRQTLRKIYGEKVAKLRANGNIAAADALILKYKIPPEWIPTLDEKGKRRGKAPRIAATEEAPPPKHEPINKQLARRRDRA